MPGMSGYKMKEDQMRMTEVGVYPGCPPNKSMLFWRILIIIV